MVYCSGISQKKYTFLLNCQTIKKYIFRLECNKNSDVVYYALMKTQICHFWR